MRLGGSLQQKGDSRERVQEEEEFGLTLVVFSCDEHVCSMLFCKSIVEWRNWAAHIDVYCFICPLFLSPSYIFFFRLYLPLANNEGNT